MSQHKAKILTKHSECHPYWYEILLALFLVHWFVTNGELSNIMLNGWGFTWFHVFLYKFQNFWW